MKAVDFIQTSIFATFLTLLFTLATCIITGFYEYRKMKVENFESIYKCLEEFAKRKAEILDKCHVIARELEDSLPEKWNGKSDEKWNKKYQSTYQGINEIIAEYSKFLELFLSFSHYLYKSNPVIPIIKAECWSILNLYDTFMEIECGQAEYKIKYSQIVALVQFIRLTGKRDDKKRLREYLSRNRVFE